jgi:hypothetical protein
MWADGSTAQTHGRYLLMPQQSWLLHVSSSSLGSLSTCNRQYKFDRMTTEASRPAFDYTSTLTCHPTLPDISNTHELQPASPEAGCSIPSLSNLARCLPRLRRPTGLLDCHRHTIARFGLEDELLVGAVTELQVQIEPLCPRCLVGLQICAGKVKIPYGQQKGDYQLIHSQRLA